jgi:hypothetical protein
MLSAQVSGNGPHRPWASTRSCHRKRKMHASLAMLPEQLTGATLTGSNFLLLSLP